MAGKKKIRSFKSSAHGTHKGTGINEALLLAAEKGDIEAVRTAIDAGAGLAAKSSLGNTALCVAASAGHIDIVGLLLEKGADVHAQDDRCMDPLSWAALRGYDAIVRLLLDHGAVINTLNGSGWPPIGQACSQGRLDVVKTLITYGADVNLAFDSGRTALMCAAYQGHTEIVKELLKAGADKSQQYQGMKVRDLAEQQGNIDVVGNSVSRTESVQRHNPMTSRSSLGGYDFHKDRKPSRTVERIKSRLERLGFLEENAYLNWKQPYENCFSCFLTFRDYPFFISNGKGMTAEFALASAYAEFIERLQCKGGFHFARLGLIKNQDELPALRRTRNRDELYVDHPVLFEKMDPRLSPLLPDELPCLPVCDIFSRSVVDLPISLMYAASGTTGMCSGNSFEEACSQGLCEIMERHVLHRFYTGEVDEVPTVDLRKIRLRSSLLKSLVEKIQESGCVITVKDFTLEGKFPVLGMVLRERKTGKVAVALGSDPILDIALQRCLTEALQGRSRPELDPAERNTGVSKPDSVYNAPHLVAERLLRGAGESRFEDAFLDQPATNQEYLRFLLTRLNPGEKVFIRDFSILGFPSYYLYAENMSPINPDLLLDVKLVGDTDRILDVIFHLPEASRVQIKDVAALLFEYAERHESSFLLQLGKLFTRVPVFSWLDPRWLLAFLLVEAEEYEKAFVTLKQTVPGLAGIAIVPDPPAAAILARYCRMKASGERDQDVLKRLREEFGNTKYTPRLEHLVNKNYAGFAGEDPNGWKFDGLPIPRCHDRSSCRGCPCRKDCFQERWYELRSAFKERARKIDQRGILAKIASFR